MAVSIDNVYQKVLAIANKEQRGYLTPQEFNLFADQVQMEIFEQYFYDINQFNRAPGNNTEYADMLNLLEEKIAIFKNIKLLYYQSPYYQKPRESPLAKPTLKRSVFIDMPRGYRVYPTFTKNVHCHYIRRPAEAKWGYNIIGGNALYDATISEDFQLHASEEQNLITKILALTGITLNKPGLVQIAENSDAKNIQLKKA